MKAVDQTTPAQAGDVEAMTQPVRLAKLAVPTTSRAMCARAAVPMTLRAMCVKVVALTTSSYGKVITGRWRSGGPPA
jgi:hypothetical protein